MASKSDAAKKKFEADYKSGKMKVNAGEVISPAKIVGKAAAIAVKPILKVAAKKAVKQNKKTVEKVAKMQEKTKTEKIAKNSVKVTPVNKAAVRLEKNSAESARVNTAKTGAWARHEAGQIEKTRRLPSKVVKIRSGK